MLRRGVQKVDGKLTFRNISQEKSMLLAEARADRGGKCKHVIVGPPKKLLLFIDKRPRWLLVWPLPPFGPTAHLSFHTNSFLHHLFLLAIHHCCLRYAPTATVAFPL